MSSIINLEMESQRLGEAIAEVRQYSGKVSKGQLIARKSSYGGYRYYKKIILPDGSEKEIYMRGKKPQEAISMAQSLYADQKLEELQQEKSLTDQLLAFHVAEKKSEVFLKKRPGIAHLLQVSEKEELEKGYQWMNAAYPKNTRYPEQLKYTTVVPGFMVRSKAEADIVAGLEKYNIPYRYEEILHLNGKAFAMDFSCMHLRTGNIWYWDHRGMPEDPQYIKKILYCDEHYLNAGIIPWINLIITTETKEHPLDLQWVDTLIRYYLL